MVKVEFRAVTEDDVRFVVKHIAKDNEVEILVSGVPKRDFEYDFLVAFRRSDFTSAMFIDGKCQMVSGVCPEFLDRRSGVLWLIFTQECKDRFWVQIARYSKRVLGEYLKQFDRVYNWVNAESVKIRRWHRWLGYEEKYVGRLGPFGIRHFYYEKRREF